MAARTLEAKQTPTCVVGIQCTMFSNQKNNWQTYVDMIPRRCLVHDGDSIGIGISAPHRVPPHFKALLPFQVLPAESASSLDRQASFHKHHLSAAFDEKHPSIFPEDAFVRQTFARAG